MSAIAKEQKQIEEKLKELQLNARRNERQIRKAFVRYEELLAAKASLEASISALREFGEKRRSNSLHPSGMQAAIVAVAEPAKTRVKLAS